VSLARAAYARPDLVLLDDPLSALDAGTAKQVFSRLIKSPNAYYSNTAVLLVTHASHFLNRVDSLMVIVDGTKTFHGTWNELAAYSAPDTKTQSAIDFIRSSVQEGDSSDGENETLDEANHTDTRRDSDTLKSKTLMTVEEREHGLSSLHTWFLWFKQAGGFFYIGLLVLLMTVDRFAYVATEYWLARWTTGAYEPVDVFGTTFPPQSDGRSAQYQYLTVYAIILLISAIFTILR
jgi:ABC-type sulfate/molybdate transport systems ATPase subunit